MDVPQQRQELTVGQHKNLVAVDTGPLLCFGHFAGGVRLLLGRYQGRLRWPVAVAVEIANRCQIPARTRGGLAMRDAAEKWHIRHRRHLGEPQTVDIDAAARLQALVRAEAAKTKAKRQAVPSKGSFADLGEAECLVLAGDLSATALINETPARKVAKRLTIPTCCTLDVMVAEYFDRNPGFGLRQFRAAYEQLRECGLEPGGYLPPNIAERELRKMPQAAPAGNQPQSLTAQAPPD